MTQPTPPTPPTQPPGDPGPTGQPATDPPGPGPATPPADPVKDDDKPLGPAGERALAAEREARKELERKLAGLAPLEQLAKALGGSQAQSGGKSEVELLNEKFASYEKDLADERAARFRAEVAAEKGLSPAQAKWLQGSTREELEAAAAELLAAFPAAPAGPRTPAPDPSQGARGKSGAADLDTQIAEAKAKGDVWRAVALERSKLANVKR